MTDKTGGPAFPCDWYDRDSMGEEVLREQFPGMTLLDWFAGQSIVGSAERVCDFLDDNDLEGAQEEAHRHAEAAWMMADAMLAEREKS